MDAEDILVGEGRSGGFLCRLLIYSVLQQFNTIFVKLLNLGVLFEEPCLNFDVPSGHGTDSLILITISTSGKSTGRTESPIKSAHMPLCIPMKT
ncbi:MAG: hypothetical protein IKD53_08715, partial [Clostridia bacterium]|nr:hypothetical protein [Clostridia bacterium]